MAMSTDFPARRSELQAQMRRLGHEIPATMAGFAGLHKAATARGALDTKTKELIALAIAVTARCDSCISFHVHDALAAGATRAEVLDAVGVAVLMGGGPAAMYACDAMAALDQFESARK
jgi:AhpD family alkylhydroperoxidase